MSDLVSVAIFSLEKLETKGDLSQKSLGKLQMILDNLYTLSRDLEYEQKKEDDVKQSNIEETKSVDRKICVYEKCKNYCPTGSSYCSVHKYQSSAITGHISKEDNNGCE